MAVSIAISDLEFGYSLEQPVLNGLSLEVAGGEIVALLGASGCGKSTLLRAIAQLIQPTCGVIEYSGDHAARRAGDLAFVFQDATLLPWRNVLQNVALPFELNKGLLAHLSGRPGEPPASQSCSHKLDLVKRALQDVGLDSTSYTKFPRELSGGMKMRVSIARALVTEPSVMLLDEPFAALDDILRMRLNDLLLELWQLRQRTIVFVTHNIAEAVYLSHRVAILAKGRIARVMDNNLPWPRNAEMRSSMEFAQRYGEVSRALSDEAS